jgi:HEAT repeat protein
MPVFADVTDGDPLTGLDDVEDRAYLARLRSAAGDMAQWIAEAKDDAQRTQRERSCAQVLIDAEAVVRSYDAVRAALPALAILLSSESAELRAQTANLLAWFPEFAATSVPLLTAFVASEASPGATATGIVALGLLGAPETVPLIRRYLDSTKIELRWASAFALTRFGITEQAIIDVLTETVAKPPAASETMSYLSGSYRRLAEMVLYEITRNRV